MKHLKLLILIVLCSVQLFALSVPNDLAQRLSTIPLDKSAYSIHVQALNSPVPLVSWKTHTKRVPASVIKLLTSYSALLALGYDYRWETKFYHTGQIKNGVLHGNLIIEASGDPSLETEDLDGIVEQIKAAGIRRIVGDMVIDRTVFKVSSKNSSGFDQNTYSPYNAMPDALMFNERKSTLCVTLVGKRAEIKKDVPDRSYTVVNKLKLVNGSCRGKRAWPSVSVNQSTLIFSGQISRNCDDRTVCKVLTKPYLSFYYAFKDKMKSSKIAFKGKMQLKTTPKQAKYLFSHHSDTLEEIISTLAKESNNLFARQVMLTLGAKLYAKPGTLYKGRKAIEHILNRYHILEQGSTFVDNGSGLSRVSTVTAKSLANLLDHGAKNYGQRWMNTLSIAGIDGTLKKRFVQSTLFGRAWMKTGTIKKVSNIAGYVEGITGQRYVVVVLVNHKLSAKYGRKLANTVIEWVATTQ
ncbi:D-alanyl-D-alanine carboxypeptidase/D-alanyl-D-alanine-endopeptidase [bacterium]|nr:D-alanyl-D-alanine carboxypeptidase/D-alanyl-D-alanine-endopeptidase [bacterium]MBU1959114.1 D-alanyl-D-alanine carboxypeptidase/D-alanyl-D-alanine-endopeptidase [bacterium]